MPSYMPTHKDSTSTSASTAQPFVLSPAGRGSLQTGTSPKIGGNLQRDHVQRPDTHF